MTQGRDPDPDPGLDRHEELLHWHLVDPGDAVSFRDIRLAEYWDEVLNKPMFLHSHYLGNWRHRHDPGGCKHETGGIILVRDGADWVRVGEPAGAGGVWNDGY